MFVKKLRIFSVALAAVSLALLFLSTDVPSRCNCKPALKKKPYRDAVKHDTNFSALHVRKSFITTETIRGWEKKYPVNMLVNTGRMPGTPEDTLYSFRGWLYQVKTTEDDCDLHLQVGPKDPALPRVVLEIPPEECALQNQLIAALGKRGFRFNEQNFPGIYIEAKGPGFYDGKNKGKTDNKHEAGCSWELHPLKSIELK